MADPHSWFFIALPLTAEHVERLQPLQAAVIEAAPKARLVRPDRLHVTAAFLGPLDAGQQAAAATIVEQVASEASVGGALQLEARELAAFGGGSALATVVTGRDEHRLAAVHETLVERCAIAGLPVEQRRWRPHLTIARMRRSDATRVIRELQPEAAAVPFAAGALRLVESARAVAAAGGDAQRDSGRGRTWLVRREAEIT